LATNPALFPFGFLKTARARLFVLVSLVVLPALVVLVYGAWSDLQQNLDERRAVSTHAAKQAQAEFAGLLDETRAVFTDLVRVPQMRAPNNCTQVFTSLRFAYERLAPNVTNLGLAEANGEIYCAINPVQGGKNLAKQVDFIAALESLDLSLGLYAPNPVAGSPLVSLSYPILSFDGQVQTVIFATFDTRWLETWQGKTALPKGTALTLFTPDGRVLWRTVSGKQVPVNGRQAAGQERFPGIQAEQTASEGPDLDGVIRLNTFVPLQLEQQPAASLHVGYPVTELYTQAYGELYWKLGLLGLVFSVAMLVAWWGSETMFLRPLNNLMRAVERVQAGDLSARAGTVGGLGELAALAQSFDAMTDALQRREAERQQLEERFRAAFESSAIGMGLMTIEGKILAVNAAVCAMSGYTEAELIQRNDHENVYPPDAQVGLDLFAEMLAGKRANYSVERRYVRKNGEFFWVRLTLSLVRAASGEPAYLVGQIEDIDEQKRKSAALAESEARFRAMFENAAVGISLVTPDGQTIAVNPLLVQLSGYSEAELLELGGQGVTFPEDRPLGLSEFHEILAGKRNSFQVEKRYVHRDGRTHWMRQSVSAVRDSAGAVQYMIVIAEDIEERKRALAELQESEARFRTMFETSAIGIGIMGLDRKVINANPALCQMYGYSLEELIGQTNKLVVHPDDYPLAGQHLQELLTGKVAQFSAERRYLRKNGDVFWARVAMSMVHDAHGAPLYIVGMVADINEERLALAKLQESEARFRSMFDNAAVGVAVMSLDRHITQINQIASRLTGYSAEEIVEIDPSMLAVEADRYIDRELFAELIAGQRDQYTVEKRYIRKDGSIFWGRVNFSAVRGKDGKPLYTIGMIEDITEEKEAARTLAESEARFRTLYDSAEMGIVLVDLGTEGTLPLDESRFNQLVANQQLNPAMQRMFGYSAEELQNIPIAELIYPEDLGLDAREFRQLLTGEIDSFRSEKRFVRKDGSVFWGRLSDSLARTADGAPRMVIGIIEDITEEKRAAEKLAAQEAEYRTLLEQRIAERTTELNLANERLREKAAQDAVAAERTRLARDLHDAVTQTLFSTTLIADVLPDIWEMNQNEGKRRLEEVRQLTRGALAEMRTLLVELRPNALVEVPLPTLLRQLTEALIGRSRMNIELSAEGERKLPADVQVGLYRLAQEALNNVVKHAKASQAVVSLRMGETVRLTVADNGAGFDPSTVTADHLGLKIMRERAEAIGAKLTIDSEPGEGTQISVVWEEKPFTTK